VRQARYVLQPGRIPPEHLKPHAFDKGIILENAGVVRRRLRGDGKIAFALEEGGPANGVRTPSKTLSPAARI